MAKRPRTKRRQQRALHHQGGSSAAPPHHPSSSPAATRAPARPTAVRDQRSVRDQGDRAAATRTRRSPRTAEPE